MPYDVDELHIIRRALRTLYVDLRARNFRSSEARDAVSDIDGLCVDITMEIEAFEPELPFNGSLILAGASAL